MSLLWETLTTKFLWIIGELTERRMSMSAGKLELHKTLATRGRVHSCPLTDDTVRSTHRQSDTVIVDTVLL